MKKETLDTLDATLPRTPITIKGKTYLMCLDLGALSQAERELVNQGHKVNLLLCLPPIGLDALRVLFAVSLRRFQPEITYDEALQLLTVANVQEAYSAFVDAWNAAIAEPSEDGGKENPTEPGS